MTAAERLTPGILAAVLTGILAAFLAAAPGGGGFPPAPDFLLMTVFYWRVTRPGDMPLVLVFALGLLHDAILGRPFGLSSGALLIAALFLQGATLRAVKAPFSVKWANFVGFAAVAFFASYVLMTLIRLDTPPRLPVLAQYGMTVLAYPVLSALFRRVFRIKPRESR